MSNQIGSARDLNLHTNNSSSAGAADSKRLNQPIPRLSISQITTFRLTLDEDVQHYLDAGIGAMGLWLRKLFEFGEERGIDLLQESELSVSSVSHAGGFTGVNHYSFAESLEDGRHAIDICHALDAQTLVVLTGGRHGHTRNHAHRLVRDGLRELASYAATRDVTLAVQPVQSGLGSDWTFLHTLGQAVDMLDAVDLPNVQLAVDLFHLQSEADLLEKLTALVPRIAIVQLSDCIGEPWSAYDRVFPGDGQLPIIPVMDALLAAGYTGMFDVQVWSPALWSSNYQHILRQCRDRFENLCSLSASA